jgi:hypothetical protein
MALRLRARGFGFKEIGEEIDASMQTAWNAVMKPRTRIVKPFSWSPGPGRLTLADREEISLGLRHEDTLSAIAGQLGRAVSTVSREVANNGGRAGFSYTTTSDNDVVAYNTSAPGTVQPTAKQSPAGTSGAAAVLITASP